MKIFDDENIMNVGNAWLLVRETIRDTIRHPVVRAWANKMIDKYDNEYGSGIISNLQNNDMGESIDLNNIVGDIKEGMSCLFKKIDIITTNNTTINEQTGEIIETGDTTTYKAFGDVFSASFTFDGKTGRAVGAFTTLDPSKLTITPILNNEGTFINTSLREQILNNTEITTKNFVENVGDMVKSSYLILDERNVLDDNFQVQAWEPSHPDYSYEISHDVQDRLLNLHFEFKNMYL